MSAHALQKPVILGPDEFLRLYDGTEGKFELVRGRVVEMMINASRNHARLAYSLGFELGLRLDRARYDIGSADFGVRTGGGNVRFPDVFVDRAGGGGKDLAVQAPLLLAEILSPSSFARDFGEKALEYTALPTLLHYIVLSPDEPRAWLWSRDGGGEFAEPVLFEGGDAVLDLSGLDISLPLAEVYRGIA